MGACALGSVCPPEAALTVPPPHPVSSAGVISLPRSSAAILHAGASGERARLPLPGRRRGAGGELGGKGRHFRLGPRVSPERRHLLRLLSLLPAETPAPVSDWVCGPGTRVPRGRGALPCPAAVPRTHSSPPRMSVLHCRARGRGSPTASPLQDHFRYLTGGCPLIPWDGYEFVFISNEPLKCQGPPRILSLPLHQLPPRDSPHATSFGVLTG